MKETLLILLLFACTLAQAQIKAPDAVTAAFSKKFPDARHVKWGKENAKEFEAGFELKGRKMSANFDLQGNWKETEMEIDVIDLPAAVVKSIHSKYPDAVISGADRTEKADGKIIYEAGIKMKGKKMEVELFGDGRFVK